MDNAKKPEEMSLSELIRGFEDDMKYDCHSFLIQFGRSEHRQELQRRGREALSAIIAHLEGNLPSSCADLAIAWGKLLNEIEIKIDPEKTGPKRLDDTKGWITWAKRMIGSKETSFSVC